MCTCERQYLHRYTAGSAHCPTRNAQLAYAVCARGTLEGHAGPARRQGASPILSCDSEGAATHPRSCLARLQTNRCRCCRCRCYCCCRHCCRCCCCCYVVGTSSSTRRTCHLRVHAEMPTVCSITAACRCRRCRRRGCSCCRRCFCCYCCLSGGTTTWTSLERPYQWSMLVACNQRV